MLSVAMLCWICLFLLFVLQAALSLLLHTGFLWLGVRASLCCSAGLQCLLLQSTSSRCTGFSSHGFWALEHRRRSWDTWADLLQGIEDLPDQGLNPRPLHWQADRYPLYHQ